MSKIQTTRRSAIATVVASLIYQNSAQAKTSEDYPAKPVRFIIPFAPGGATDILGRIIGKEYFHSKEPVIAENIVGAGGNVAASLVARSANDGYTLEVGAMSMHAMNGSMYKKLTFEPMKDFEPIAMLAYAINVIAVSSSLPVQSFPELLAYIRANPGKVNYASGGVGTHNHLTLALLAKIANLDIVHVPYKGGGPAVMALVQGECALFAGGATLLLPHVKAGKVRIIAVTEGMRTSLLPGIPSVSETLKGFEVTNWYGLFAPKGIDATLKLSINQEINRITGLREVEARFTEMGMVRASMTPARLAEVLQQDYKMWSAAIRELSITAE